MSIVFFTFLTHVIVEEQKNPSYIPEVSSVNVRRTTTAAASAAILILMEHIYHYLASESILESSSPHRLSISQRRVHLRCSCQRM